MNEHKWTHLDDSQRPKPAQLKRVPWRDMTGTSRFAYVGGWVITVIFVVGGLVLVAGLMWRAIAAVWGIR